MAVRRSYARPMLVSTHNLRRYLGTDLPPDRMEDALIHAGFPIESREVLPGGNIRLDVEVTSNRGDCLSHLALAREIAAQAGIALRPARSELPRAKGPPVASVLSLSSQAGPACPRFTARVVRGVRIGESPAWLREHLESVGQRSINNVVDVTNFICSELGNPCHVFDLARLAGPALVVRFARPGETLVTLDGRERKLDPGDLVVADSRKPQSLAGVIGGQESEVSERTTDIVIEMATWDPLVVRRTARRHQIRTDASYRFERLVDPRTLDSAGERCAALILEVAGGTLCDGLLDVGLPLPRPTRVHLRPARCRALLGLDLTVDEMAGALRRLEIDVESVRGEADELRCTIPPFRPDLTREEDLIEEVARVVGYGRIPVRETLTVRVAPPQARESARRELARVLTGLGFHETVTFSFTTPALAAAFCPAGLEVIQLNDERRGNEPALRPSILPGLLACRMRNHHAQVRIEGGVRLYEVAATYAQSPRTDGPGDGRAYPATHERQRLALLLDVPLSSRKVDVSDLQKGVRLLRGAIERVVGALGGPSHAPHVEACEPPCAGFDPAACARVSLAGRPVGHLGLIAPGVVRACDLPVPVAGAELDLDPLLSAYPPGAAPPTLPAFPGIERDLSLVVGEAVSWADIERAVRTRAAGPLEGISFVGTYRGPQVGAGRKSVTLRLTYRRSDRTLQHDEIDRAVAALVSDLRAELGAELRG
jgi:phenylalanyl-tRNA synthetase beta chain